MLKHHLPSGQPLQCIIDFSGSGGINSTLTHIEIHGRCPSTRSLAVVASYAQAGRIVDPSPAPQHRYTTNTFAAVSQCFYTIMTRQRINGWAFTVIT